MNDSSAISIQPPRRTKPAGASSSGAAAVGNGKEPLYDPACSIFRRYLKAKGQKFTPERAMILDGVMHQDGLFSAEALVDDLLGRQASVSRATVYRTLTHLADAGIVRQVCFDAKQSYFERTAGRSRHDYLIDSETGRVMQLTNPKWMAAIDEALAEMGYERTGHQLIVHGVAKRD